VKAETKSRPDTTCTLDVRVCTTMRDSQGELREASQDTLPLHLTYAMSN
jgi:hypothetical protein